MFRPESLDESMNNRQICPANILHCMISCMHSNVPGVQLSYTCSYNAYRYIRIIVFALLETFVFTNSQ